MRAVVLSSVPFNGVKVFSATMLQQREQLGEVVTDWLAAHRHVRLCEIVVTQSSDSAFHCVTITIFFFEPPATTTPSPTSPPPRRRHSF